MKNLLRPQQSQGQALLLVIVVLFIVFFLVVSVSQNVAIDTVNTAQNQNFNKAFVAAQTGVNQAKAYVANLIAQGQTLPSGRINCSNAFISDPNYQCEYVITANNQINQTIAKDQSVQASVAGSTKAQVEFNDASSILLVNVIESNNSNFMCLFYPSTISLPSSASANLSQITNPAGCNNGTGSVTVSNGYYSATVDTGGANSDFIRASIINYSSDRSNVIIIPNGNSGVQQYQITATGFYNQSRRVIVAYLSVYGNPPAIFDYVLFNGSSNISF